MSDVKPASKVCPRCQLPFECRSQSIATCHCSQLSISAAQRAYINSRYEACLCHQCLQDLCGEYNQATDAGKASRT